MVRVGSGTSTFDPVGVSNLCRCTPARLPSASRRKLAVTPASRLKNYYSIVADMGPASVHLTQLATKATVLREIRVLCRLSVQGQCCNFRGTKIILQQRLQCITDNIKYVTHRHYLMETENINFEQKQYAVVL